MEKIFSTGVVDTGDIIVDTGGKFATGVNNTRGTAAKFAASVIIKIYCHINLSFDTRSTGYGMKRDIRHLSLVGRTGIEKYSSVRHL